MVNSEKSPNMSSAKGRMPVMAAPTPSPDITPPRQWGLSMTRSPPELLEEALAAFEDAAGGPHILAHDKDGRVASHLFGRGHADRFSKQHVPIRHIYPQKLVLAGGRRLLCRIRWRRGPRAPLARTGRRVRPVWRPCWRPCTGPTGEWGPCSQTTSRPHRGCGRSERRRRGAPW